MKAGADMKTAGKTVYVFVLLTITKVMRTAGDDSVSATVGSSPVLPCPSKSNITMVTWKISPKAEGPCRMGYRSDQNKTDRTNCSDSMNWKSQPDQDPALEIKQVAIAHEGSYTCEVVAAEGNFHRTLHLTVLALPRLTVYCGDDGSPVCEAAAGKPAARVSWDLDSKSTLKEEGHDNGTVTVLSKFAACSTNVTNITCIVSHPARDQRKSIACCYPNKNGFKWYVVIIPCFLIIITFMAAIYYFKLPSDRPCHKAKPPDTAPTDSPQDDTMEVEPYTTYVQKENVIYNSVSDLTVEQNHLQGLSPAT